MALFGRGSRAKQCPVSGQPCRRNLETAEFDPRPTSLRRSKLASQAEAAAEGVMPCEVMLANMRFAYGRALELQAMLAKTVENEVDLALLDEVVRLRGIAQDWAKDVANYYHPKLASVTHKGNAENPLLGPVTDTDRLKGMVEFLLANPEVLKHPQISKMLQ
jgi:hypothetical protein